MSDLPTPQAPTTQETVVDPIARAAAGLGMTVSEYLNRTFGDTLPPAPVKQPPQQQQPQH